MGFKKVLLLASSPISEDEGYGTERIVSGLAGQLCKLGVDARVCGHGTQGQSSASQVVSEDGVPTYILPAAGMYSRQEYFSRLTREAPGFAEVLRIVQPYIVQFHGVSASSTNVRHVELAKKSGSTTVLWHNVPGVSCLQQGLLFRGNVPCDGKVLIRRCTYCRLRALTELPDPVAKVSSVVGFGRLSRLLPHRLESLVGARSLTRLHAEGVKKLFEHTDTIQVGAEWARTVLLINGYPCKKMFLIRPGVDLSLDRSVMAEPRTIWRHVGACRPLRLIFWGRMHRSKGMHTILEALEASPDLNVEVGLIGNLQGSDPYVVDIRERASADARVRVLGRLRNREILPVLRTADVALIPSRFFETGPITVFEARAAGLPIIGSDRGGVAEVCQADASTMTFEAENAHELAACIASLVDEPSRINHMRQHVKRARTLKTVAEDVVDMYSCLSTTGGILT